MADSSGLTGAGRPRAVADALGGRDNQPTRPRAAFDDDHLGRLSGGLLPSGIKGVQARGEEVRIPAPVWMMRSDKIPATAPDFACLTFVHLRNDGPLAPIGREQE
jgi:hypothetical protein